MKKSTQKISFLHASNLLSGFIDLEMEMKKTLEKYKKWGLIKALINAKIIKDKNELIRNFTESEFEKNTLEKLKEKYLSSKIKILPIFIPPLSQNKFNLSDLFHLLFKGDKILHIDPELTERVLGDKLSSIKKIDPKTIPFLNLKSLNLQQRRVVFKRLYHAAKFQNTEAEIIFTFENPFNDKKKQQISLSNDFSKIKSKKIKIISPAADFILKKIQSEKINLSTPFYQELSQTFYFNWIFPDGYILSSHWSQGRNKQTRIDLQKQDLLLSRSNMGDFGLRPVF